MVEGDDVMEANVEARPVIRVQPPAMAEPKEGVCRPPSTSSR